MIRFMEETDLEQVAHLEELCFSPPWSISLLRQGLGYSLDTYWVLETGQSPVLIGYAALRILAGEAELQRIAVDPAYQGRGYARELMGEITAFSRKNQVSDLILEVRSGNAAARNLYKSYGFREEAVRRDYYEHPAEDAVLMRLKIV